MKKHQILTTTLLTCWLSFLMLNTSATAGKNGPTSLELTGSAQLFRGESTYTLKANNTTRLNNDIVNGRDIVIARSTLPLDYHGAGLDIVVTLYDTIRLKGEIGKNISKPEGDMEYSTGAQGVFDNLGLHPTDQHAVSSEAKLTDFEATNANLDLEWVLPFWDSWKFSCGIGYLQETFQHEGRVLSPSDSADDNYSPTGPITSFETGYHLLYPLVGLEKQISRNTTISGVVKFPAYVWTEYEVDDPAVEQFGAAINNTDDPTGTGFSGRLSLDHQFSENMFLRADIRYTVLQADSSGMAIDQYNLVGSMESKQIGGMVKLGVTW